MCQYSILGPAKLTLSMSVCQTSDLNSVVKITMQNDSGYLNKQFDTKRWTEPVCVLEKNVFVANENLRSLNIIKCLINY